MKTKIIIPNDLIEKTNEEIIKYKENNKKDPWDKETRENWNEKMNS